MNRSYERMNRTPGLSISPRESNAGKLLKAASATNSKTRKLRNSGKNTAGRKVRVARPKMGIDITWVTERIGVGGGIWTAENMAAVARAGVTHIIDMQIEFDDTPLGERHGIAVCWNPVDDDFEPKPSASIRAWSGFCAGSAGRRRYEIVGTLRGGSTPGTDDDAGAVGCDGLEPGRRNAVGGGATAGSRFCRSVCAERGGFSAGAELRAAFRVDRTT